MVWLVLGLVLFLGVHSIAIISPDGRNRLAAQLGENAFKGLYSLASFAGLALIVWGYGVARETPVLLYALPGGFRHLAALLMLPVFVLLLAAYLPGRIQRAAKHPMLLSVKLWATAHLLANGDLASVLLFVALLAWGVVLRISYKRRVRAGELVLKPFVSARFDAIAVVGSIVLWAVITMWLHKLLIGVAPLAM